VAAGDGHRVDHLLSYLVGELAQLFRGEFLDVPGIVYPVEQPRLRLPAQSRLPLRTTVDHELGDLAQQIGPAVEALEMAARGPCTGLRAAARFLDPKHGYKRGLPLGGIFACRLADIPGIAFHVKEIVRYLKGET
jgi:hypothetical protein